MENKQNEFADVFMPAELFEKIRTAYQGKKYLFEVDEFEKKNGKRKKQVREYQFQDLQFMSCLKKQGQKLTVQTFTPICSATPGQLLPCLFWDFLKYLNTYLIVNRTRQQNIIFTGKLQQRKLWIVI
jgi:hypothetical protein